MATTERNGVAAWLRRVLIRPELVPLALAVVLAIWRLTDSEVSNRSDRFATLWHDWRVTFTRVLVAMVGSLLVAFAVGFCDIAIARANVGAGKRTARFIFWAFLAVGICLVNFPLIALARILAVRLDPGTIAVIFGMLMGTVPLVAVLSSSLKSSVRLEEVITISGASSGHYFLWFAFPLVCGRIIQASRLLLVGTVIGVTIAEAGNSTWGLGSALRNALQVVQTDVTWDIIVVLLVTVLTGYFVLGIVGQIASDLEFGVDAQDLESVQSQRNGQHLEHLPLGRFLGLVAGAFILWELSVRFLIRIPELSILSAAHWCWRHSDNAHLLWEAARSLGVSWGIAAIALLVSGVFAFLLLLLHSASRPLARILLSPLLITQVIPMVAFVAIIDRIAGRGWVALIAVAVSVTFYRIFETAAAASDAHLRQLEEVLDVAGFSRSRLVQHLSVPLYLRTVPTVIVAILPLTLQAVILGEWLLTLTGVGGIMYKNSSSIGALVTISALCTVTSISLTIISGIVCRRASEPAKPGTKGVSRA